jgi:signal transduction histidine kinase
VTLEPGLLAIFRLFVVVEIFFVLLRAAVDAWRPGPAPWPSPWPGVMVQALFLGYLSSAALRARLGRAYLPPALVWAVAGPLVGSAATMHLRLEAGATGDELIRSSWVLIVFLLVPVVLVAWQYGFRWVVAMAALTTAADLALTLPLSARGGPPVISLAAVAVVRCLFFLPVGYAVARLVNMQREQRDALRAANARLAEQSAQLEQLAVSRERNRLARELHDTLAHGLSALAVQLEAMNALWDSQPGEARARLAGALETTRASLREARRAIGDLRATPLDELGFAGALRALAESAASRGGLELDLLVDGDGALGAGVQSAMYRIASEALANAVRHAQAARIAVRFERCGPDLVLVISDDGRGFDPALPAGPERYGRRGMEERAREIGARLTIESAAGQGTTVRLTLSRDDDPRPHL